MKVLMVTVAALASVVITVANAAPLAEAKPDEVGFSKQGLDRLDDFFDREISAKRVPGAVVAIARVVSSSITRLTGSSIRPVARRCSSTRSSRWRP